MSCELIVWNTATRLSDEQATAVYAALCEDNFSALQPSAAVEVFYKELTERFPDLYVEHSPSHVVVGLNCGNPDEVEEFAWQLAHDLGLAIFDPQDSMISYPIAGGGFTRTRPGTGPSSILLGFLLAGALLFLGVRGAWWVTRDTHLIVDSQTWVEGQAQLDSINLAAGEAPAISYRLYVNGEKFHGTRFEVPPTRLTRYEAKKLSERYRTGMFISVLYDPENPSNSVVIPPEMNWFFTIVLGAASLLFAWFGGYLTKRLLARVFSKRGKTNTSSSRNKQRGE